MNKMIELYMIKCKYAYSTVETGLGFLLQKLLIMNVFIYKRVILNPNSVKTNVLKTGSNRHVRPSIDDLFGPRFNPIRPCFNHRLVSENSMHGDI